MTSVKASKQELSLAFLKQPPNWEELILFKKEFIALLEHINVQIG